MTAQEVFDALRARANDARRGHPPSTVVALVDGTAYSPSSRAIDGAEAVYQGDDADAWHAFDDELEELIGGYDDDGWSLAWDDGMLWLWGPAAVRDDE